MTIRSRGPFTAEEVARRAGVPADAVAKWAALGLLAPPGGDGSDDDAVGRARLVRFATERGVRAEDVADLARRDGDVLGRFLDLLPGSTGAGHTLEEAAALVGVDATLLRRLWIASGFGGRHELFDDDVDALRGMAAAIESGLPPEALVQIARVFGDALGRVADAETRLFHIYVHERLRADGRSGDELMEETARRANGLLALVEPALLYYHRKAWEQSLREDLLVHLAEEVAPPGEPVGQQQVAVLFVDLAGFTPLTEAMGDTAAAEVVDRFSDMMREAAAGCDGRVIKQIGDEFMLVFRSAAAALRCGLEMARRVDEEVDFPAVRMGAHTGPALYREADYLGQTVNLAARVASAAGRGELVVTEPFRDEVGDAVTLRWIPRGKQSLKGVGEPVALFAVDREDAERHHRPVDPVCGMQLDAATCRVRLAWEGSELLFCSTACRDRFVAEPGRFTGR